MSMHVLVVEDDADLRAHMAKSLSTAGHSVDTAPDGLEGLHLATEGKFDVIVMDRMMPKLDGLAMLQAMRTNGNSTPVLILSAMGQVDDRVHGLGAGADDYMTKPFAISELLARVTVLGRRSPLAASESPTLSCADLTLNLLKRTAQRGSTTIKLQNQEFRLLEYLLRHQGQVVTRAMLLEQVWGYHFDPGTNLVDAHIAKLRRKVDDGHTPALIHTVRGAGYKLDVA